jgi:predicted metal-dependent peptidase
MAMNPVTPAMRAKAQENLRKAKVQLVLHQPFFASIVLKRSIQMDDAMPTACMTANGKIIVGTEFLSKQTVQKTVGLLAHESMHYAMLHHQRVGWRKPRPANKAMDKVINDILTASGMELPDGGVMQAGARDYAWEQLYNEDDDDGGGEYQPGTGNDDLSSEGVNDMGPEEIQQIKQELIQAATAAKAKGTMPAGLEQLIKDIVNPPTPWHQLLERFMLLQIKAGTSWKRPNKRWVCHDLYMPSQDVEPRMGTVVIQMDESGSVGMAERRHFFGHVNKIIESCKPEKIYLLHTDARVHLAEEFTMDDLPINYKNVACGGTDMTVGFGWVEEQGIEPDVFVCLTDGETPWLSEPAGYPVVVLCTTDAELPFCEMISYEVTED